MRKMIGRRRGAACRACCTCRPFSPTSRTSRTRQAGPSGSGCFRNSRADAKVSTCIPSERMRRAKARRTWLSSSTTKTVGAVTSMPSPVVGRSLAPLFRGHDSWWHSASWMSLKKPLPAQKNRGRLAHLLHGLRRRCLGGSHGVHPGTVYDAWRSSPLCAPFSLGLIPTCVL